MSRGARSVFLARAPRAHLASRRRPTGEGNMSDLVLLDVEEHVATLTLNRPEKLNAFKDDMRDALVPALDRVAGDSEVRVLVITGAGRAFSAGGDIQRMVDLQQ